MIYWDFSKLIKRVHQKLMANSKKEFINKIRNVIISSPLLSSGDLNVGLGNRDTIDFSWNNGNMPLLIAYKEPEVNEETNEGEPQPEKPRPKLLRNFKFPTEDLSGTGLTKYATKMMEESKEEWPIACSIDDDWLRNIFKLFRSPLLRTLLLRIPLFRIPDRDSQWVLECL